MQNQGIDEKLMSDEDLQKRRIKLRNALILSGITTVILIIFLVEITLKSGMYLTLIGVAFVPLSMLPLYTAMKKINKELKARDLH